MIGLFFKTFTVLCGLTAAGVGVGLGYFSLEGGDLMKRAEDKGWLQEKTPEKTMGEAPLSVFEATVAKAVFGDSWNEKSVPCRAFMRTVAGLIGTAPKDMTVSQTLARDIRYDLEKSREFRNGMREAALACKLEETRSDTALLRIWLAHTYAGKGFKDFEAASQSLFGKPTARLDQKEAARLVALVETPNIKSDPKLWKARSDAILARLQPEPSTGGTVALTVTSTPE